MIVALVLAAGAGVAVVLSQQGGKPNTQVSNSAAAQPSDPSPTPSASAETALNPVTRIDGYSVPIPAGWQEFDTGVTELYGFAPADSVATKRFRFQFSKAGNTRGKSAEQVFRDGSNTRANASAGSQYYVPGFHVIAIKTVPFAGKQSGGSWEYTWTDNGVKRHNLLYGAVGSDGRSYQLSYQAAEVDFATYRGLYDRVVAGAKVTA
jgi:hypothetical protein